MTSRAGLLVPVPSARAKMLTHFNNITLAWRKSLFILGVAL